MLRKWFFNRNLKVNEAFTTQKLGKREWHVLNAVQCQKVSVTGGGGLRWRVTEMRLEAWVKQIMEGPVDHQDHNGSRIRE